MANKNTAVFGIYPNRTAAEEAVGHLRSAGFRNTDPSALFPENQGTKDLAHEKNTKAPEGLATGAVLGGIVGGVFGWLIAIGVLAIPRLAPYTAAGPVVSALAGAGALGILCAIIGALVGLGIPEYEAKRFEGRIREGGVLLSVHCDNHEWVKRAKNVLEDTGAQSIASAGEKSGDFANADKPLPRVRTAGGAVATADEVYADKPVPRVRPVATSNVVTSDEIYADKPLPPRVRPAAPGSVVTGDEMYTERVVRRRTVQDPESLE